MSFDRSVLDFSAHPIVAGLMRLLARLDPHDVVLGQVVIDAIENRILPKLHKEMEQEQDAGKREELQQTIALWEKYGDPNTVEGRSWNEDAADVVGGVTRLKGGNDDEAEDLASQLAAMFYTEPRLRTMFDRYDIKTGPKGLMGMWKKTLHDEATSYWRTYWRHDKGFESIDAPSEEGHGLHETIPDVRSTSDEDFLPAALERVFAFVEQHLTGATQKTDRQLLRLWSEQAIDKGPDHVNMSKDIFPSWHEATGLSQTSMDDAWNKIKKLLRKGLEELEGITLNNAQARKLHLADSVASEFIEQQMARWIMSRVRTADWYKGA